MPPVSNSKPNAGYPGDSDGTSVFRAHWARDERGLRRALKSILDRGARVKWQNGGMALPAATAMERVNEVMSIAGNWAKRHPLRAGTPMAMAGLVAMLIRRLPQD